MTRERRAAYLEPRVLLMLPLGFASGLPLALSGATLQAWYTDAGVDLRTIGLLGLVGLPYTYKFLWAPVLDRVQPLPMDRRRSWLLLCQLLLAAAVAVLARLDPSSAPTTIALLALLIATLSATQDMAFDAYRTELLETRSRGPGTALAVMGYRLGMLGSGGLTVILAASLGWSPALSLSAVALALLAAVSTWCAPSPVVPESAAPAYWLRDLARGLQPLLQRPGWPALLAIVLLYKLGDAWVAGLSSAFLLRGAGYELATVGEVSKVYGLLATLAGAAAGGACLARYGLYRTLLGAGLLQALTNVGFVWLAGLVGPGWGALVVVVVAENLAGGLGTVPLITLIMSLTCPPYTALQFALLTAAAALPRVLLAPSVGWVAEHWGWVVYFLVGLVAALPGLLLLLLARGPVERLEAPGDAAPVEA